MTGSKLKKFSAKTGMRKLGFKGAQATEYALLCFFGALTPIIASPDMLAVGRKMYFDAAYELAKATEKSDTAEFGEADGSPGDESGLEGGEGHGDLTCLGWTDLGDKYQITPYAMQSTIRGNMVGMFQSQTYNGDARILQIHQAESLGFSDENLLLLIELDEDVDEFQNDVLISVFTSMGNNIIDRSGIKTASHSAWIGNTHIAVSKGNILLDLDGVPAVAADVVYRDGEGDDLRPSALPCLERAPWYGTDPEGEPEDGGDVDTGTNDETEQETEEPNNGNNGHGNDSDGNDDSNPGNSNDPDDHTDDDGTPNGPDNGPEEGADEENQPKDDADCQKWHDKWENTGKENFREKYEECVASEGGNGNGNNGHGNDADGNDDSNPGNSNDPDDHTDDDGAPGNSGNGKGKKK